MGGGGPCLLLLVVAACLPVAAAAAWCHCAAMSAGSLLWSDIVHSCTTAGTGEGALAWPGAALVLGL